MKAVGVVISELDSDYSIHKSLKHHRRDRATLKPQTQIGLISSVGSEGWADSVRMISNGLRKYLLRGDIAASTIHDHWLERINAFKASCMR
ncbi:hypothetical protein J6590_090552 [Homalodisca vitripennis]|nr:hypothetical protein J6590_090552 [Homalodisca vitripennis]